MGTELRFSARAPSALHWGTSFQSQGFSSFLQNHVSMFFVCVFFLCVYVCVCICTCAWDLCLQKSERALDSLEEELQVIYCKLPHVGVGNSTRVPEMLEELSMRHLSSSFSIF